MGNTERQTIGVVILNYSTYEETINLVEQLQDQTTIKGLQILVVDNASPNDSFSKLQFLEQKHSNVIVLQTGGNLGYAKGNNFGLKYLEENVKPEYVAILNNDVILPNDCFERLIERYMILKNPTVIAPVMTDINNNRQIVMGDLSST